VAVFTAAMRHAELFMALFRVGEREGEEDEQRHFSPPPVPQPKGYAVYENDRAKLYLVIVFANYVFFLDGGVWTAMRTGQQEKIILSG